MVIRIVSLKCRPEDVDAFRLLLRESSPRVRQSPGCLSLQIVNDIADPTSFFTLSTWRDRDALEAYRASPLFVEIWPRVKAFLREAAWASTCEEIKDSGLAPTVRG
jgi:quinol monooxygenase YgiN